MITMYRFAFSCFCMLLLTPVLYAQTIEGRAGDWRLTTQHDADAIGAEEFIIRNMTGVFRITGSNTTRITVVEKLTLQSNTESKALEQAKNRTLRIERRGKSLHLLSGDNWTEISSARYEISVPMKMKLQMDLSSGNIEVSDLRESVHLETGAGDVDVKKIDGLTSIRSGSGNIAVQNIRKDVVIHTGAGHVTASGLGSNLEVTTGGGNVTSSAISGDIKVVTAGGGLQISEVAGSATLFTSGGNIDVHDVKGKLDASSSGGEIVVSRIGGRADISTNGGGIRADQMEGFIRAETMAGDVVIQHAKAAFEIIAEVGNISVSIENGSFLNSMDASIEGGYGNVILNVPQNLNGVVSAVVNENGSVHVSNTTRSVEISRERPTSLGEQVRKGTYTFGDGGGRISISTRSGRITLSEQKAP